MYTLENKAVTSQECKFKEILRATGALLLWVFFFFFSLITCPEKFLRLAIWMTLNPDHHQVNGDDIHGQS